MATVYIRMGEAMGNSAPVINTKPRATSTVSSTGSSQTAPILAEGGDFIRIASVGGPIRYSIGKSPTALASSGDWVLDGQSVDAGPMSQGDQIAIIDAS